MRERLQCAKKLALQGFLFGWGLGEIGGTIKSFASIIEVNTSSGWDVRNWITVNRMQDSPKEIFFNTQSFALGAAAVGVSVGGILGFLSPECQWARELVDERYGLDEGNVINFEEEQKPINENPQLMEDRLPPKVQILMALKKSEEEKPEDAKLEKPSYQSRFDNCKSKAMPYHNFLDPVFNEIMDPPILLGCEEGHSVSLATLEYLTCKKEPVCPCCKGKIDFSKCNLNLKLKQVIEEWLETLEKEQKSNKVASVTNIGLFRPAASSQLEPESVRETGILDYGFA